MDKTNFNEFVQLIGIFGVLARLVFLGYEIQQNNELLKSDIRVSRQNIRTADTLLPVGNEDFANALIKHRHGETLTEYEILMLDRAMDVTLYNWQFVFDEYAAGRIEESSIPVENWQAMFNGESLSAPGYWPQMTKYWETNKYRNFSPNFVEWMDANILTQQ